MGRFATSWRLMGASWNLLKSDKRLVVFPVLSGIALALVIASFAAPLFNQHTLEQFHQGAHHDPAFYALWFAFYFVAYFVTIFFNCGLIACVLKQMDGGSPTVGYGLRAAWSRLPHILGWTLLASTVGFVLRMLEQRIGILGRLVVWFLGMAWSVTSFLVVPVLVAEDRGPLEAYKESVSLFKRSWGEQIIGNVSFGLIFAVLAVLPAAIVVAVAAALYPPAVAGVLALAVVYVVALALVQATLQSIYQAAVYRYAVDGAAPPGFQDEWLAAAFRAKKIRR